MASEPTTGWRPIETCPKKGEMVLFFPTIPAGKNSKLHRMIQIGHPNSYPYRQPTHWMPLPKDPEP